MWAVKVHARLVLAVSTGALLAAAVSCDGIVHDPGKHVAAEVGGQPVTVAQLQAYLEANLVQDPAADPVPPGDLARVKSRLFDDFVDNEILFQEARKRGMSVSDAELAEYLGPQAPPSPTARELARRDLTIQKLRESVVRADVKVDDRDVEAWLAAHAPDGESEIAGRLRTLRFASYPEATRVRKEIAGKKLSFAQAEAAYGADSLPDDSQDVALSAFPDHIAAAIKALQPGQVSPPLPFESSVLLFLLEAEEDPAAAETKRRERARRAVAFAQSQAIADKLLDDLRKTTPVVRHPDVLPFAYVAESAAPRAQ